MTDPLSFPVRIRPAIAGLPPYRQGRQADRDSFKLSSNENPFEPLPAVTAAIRTAAAVNRYPDASAGRLRARLAERYGVAQDEVHVGAGSVSILYQLALAVAGPGDEIVYAWRSFEAYPALPAVTGAVAVPVALGDGRRHDLEAMADAITERTRMVIVCTPNNPTGPAVHLPEFDRFLERIPNDVLIVLDEAYAEFVTDPDAVDGRRVLDLSRHPNLLVLRTFSKAYGLAGLRVGYAVGHARILAAAHATAIPLSVTAQAEEAALASLDHEAELRQRVAAIARDRDALVSDLRRIGWDIPDAQGNFVWLDTESDTLSAADAFARAGLVVRPFAGDGIRISVGEAAAMDAVTEVARRLRG